MHLSTTISKLPEPTQGNGSSFGESMLQICVFTAGLLTAACYAVGRAHLLGWHEAAGIPQLTFSWPFQEVMILGFMAVDRWFYFSAVLIAILVSLAIQLLISESFEGIVTSYLALKARGEDLSKVRLRMRFASAARDARLGKSNDDPVAMRARHKVLGSRGRRKKLKPTKRPNLKTQTNTAKTAIWLVFGAIVLVIAFVIYLGFLIFIVGAFHDGEKRFNEEYFTATGEIPPPTSIPNKNRPERLNGTLKSSQAIAKRNLEYAYIRVAEGVQLQNSNSVSSVCGWLVQSSDKQLLLLNSKGLALISYGDQAFSWRRIDPDSCN